MTFVELRITNLMIIEMFNTENWLKKCQITQLEFSYTIGHHSYNSSSELVVVRCRLFSLRDIKVKELTYLCHKVLLRIIGH